jgi:hypothetical protein
MLTIKDGILRVVTPAPPRELRRPSVLSLSASEEKKCLCTGAEQFDQQALVMGIQVLH